MVQAPDDWTKEILAAARRIAPHVRRTPVIEMRLEGLAVPIILKLENLQHTGSFKARGAFNSLLTLPIPSAGIVAASGGNHGAAVGYAARELGYRAHIFVPEMAGTAKIALIRGSGADLTVVPGFYDNALAAARAYEAETGAMQIHAFDAPATVAGQGTCFAEWEDQGLEAENVLIAVGGGGLVGGAAAWFGTRRQIIAVEPRNAPTLNRALAEGPETVVEVSGIAASSLGAKRIGRLGHDLVRQARVQSVLVDDDDIALAQQVLWRSLRQWVEPGGAAALAACLSGAWRPDPGERVAVLVCGANPVPDPTA